MTDKNIIVLYDGVCLFCEGWVNFIIKNKSSYLNIQFIPLQKIEIINIPYINKESNFDSIIVLDEYGIFFKSDASLKVMKNLIFPYNFFAYLLFFIPKIIRNYFYDLIGRNRYKIWGRRNFCIIPKGKNEFFFPKSKKEILQNLQKSFDQFFFMDKK